MRRIAFLAIVAGFLFPLMAAPAHAQATRTWVSGVGDDVNPCSRTAPCKTFAGAISKTAAGGEINCLDPGGFGAVTVIKSMTISCEVGTAGISAAGVTGINFNGGANDYLYVKGLDIDGFVATTGAHGITGISFNSGATLHVEDSSIRDFSGFGIVVKPAANATFVVQRTSLFGSVSGGIQVRPTGGASTGTIEKVSMNKNGQGIAVDGFGGTIGVNLSVRDSHMNGNGTGILATSTVGVQVMVQNSTIANSSANGLQAANAGATIRVGSSIISGNTTAINGAQVLSYGNNQLNGNAGGEAVNLVAVGGGLK
jgi:hypothetical protein